MPGNKRNRHSLKGNDEENRTGNAGKQQPGYKKLPDNPGHRSDESISTADNPANGKDSRTGKRDDEVKNSENRGGR